MRYRAEAIRLIHKKGERSEPPIFWVLSSAFLKFSIFFAGNSKETCKAVRKKSAMRELRS